MSRSINRVKTAAETAGLAIKILQMPNSTRTAAEAAAACGCDVAQIVKSLIFKGRETGALKLLLVSGAHQLDLEKAAGLIGEALERADPKEVRDITGFAIGGVSPLGHLTPIDTWMDATLLGFGTVWAAAGAPNAVFEVASAALSDAASATIADLT